ncbi:hypothetical protein D5086_015398 [Populus alba]|uniref:Uncharacterized protein n=1 Tax=Populus alba TaxID=43335 RepID=A0ACC4C0Y3_POPAL
MQFDFFSPSYDSSYIPQKDVALPQIMELSLPPNVESRTVLRSPKMIQPPRWRKNTKSTFLDASWLIWTAVKSGITVAKFPMSKLGFWAGCPNSEVRKNLRFFLKDAPRLDIYSRWLLDVYLLSCLTTMTCLAMINFSGILKEDDVLYLEQILERIPEEKFKKMRQNVSQAGEHFKWHSTRVGSYMTSFTWLFCTNLNSHRFLPVTAF